MTTPNHPGGQWPGPQPWPQQGHGYPQQQYPSGWPQQPPPPPPKQGKKFLYWLIPLVVVVVAAAVVVPIALTGGDDGGSPAAAPPASSAPPAVKTEKWQLSAYKKDVPEYHDGLASWLVDDAIVVVRDKYVASFARANGKQNWLTEVPDGQNRFCGASAVPADGKIALGFGDEKTCENATVLDLKDGKLGWQQPLKVPQKLAGTSPPEVAVLQIVGDVVFVGQEEGIAGLDLATGTQKWAKTLIRQVDNEDPCSAADLMPKDGKIVLVMTCLIGDHGLSLLSVDPATGNVELEESLPRTAQMLVGIGILSLKPLVVYSSDGTKGVYQVFDDQLKVTSTIDGGTSHEPDGLAGADGMGFGVDASGTEHNGGRAVVTDDTMYTVTTPQAGTVNALVAVDLKSGQRKWEAKIPDGTVMTPIAVENGQVITEVAPVDKKGPQRVVKVAVGDGAVTPYAEVKIKNDDRDDFGPTAGHYRYYWAEDRVYAVSGRFPQYSLDLFTVDK
jgi:outer membrane protein assembly factor BamB